MSESEFFTNILSSFAKRGDTRLTEKHRRYIQEFQLLYRKLVEQSSRRQKPSQMIAGIYHRAAKLNPEDKMTGNSLIQIVFEIMAQVKKGMSHRQVQNVIDQLILDHLDLPEVKFSRFYERRPRPLLRADLLSKLKGYLSEHREDI